MMRAPGLLGVSVLFWGWQCGFLGYAAVMALALEAVHVVRGRWDLSDRDFERISDLSAVLLAGLTLYQFDDHGFHAIFPILQSSPLVFFPLVLAQRFSTRERVSHAALFLSIRRGIRRGRLRRVRSLDVTYPFFVACVLAASAGTLVPEGFLPGLGALVAWILLAHRPVGRRLGPWLAALGAAFLAAYGGQLAMVELRQGIEPLLVQLFQERLWSRRDPYRAQTAIGHIGRLKISQRIVARVRPLEGAGAPPRLREAAYQIYSRDMWLAPGATFSDVAARGGGSVWEFTSPAATSPGRSEEVMVSSSLYNGRGVLMVPEGTFEVQGLNVDGLSRNGLGAIKVDSGPDLIEFRARFTPGQAVVSNPGSDDLSIPRPQQGLFTSLAGQLGLEALAAPEAVAAIRAHFDSGYTYSLVRRRRFGIFTEPLEDFITESRSGHCEYFATATVLLLRAAGIPARYVTGYAVNEWSPLERAFVIRRRHAHAWASAYVGGQWRDVDTTPGVWFEREAHDSPWWVESYDLLAWVRYRFDQWRYADSDWVEASTAVGLAMVLTLVLGWRLSRTTRIVRARPRPRGSARRWPGGDSELYRMESVLARSLGPRRDEESWQSWLRRAERSGHSPPGAALLCEQILPRHYRYRFDPRGLSVAERDELRALVERWLVTHAGRAGPARGGGSTVFRRLSQRLPQWRCQWRHRWRYRAGDGWGPPEGSSIGARLLRAGRRLSRRGGPR